MTSTSAPTSSTTSVSSPLPLFYRQPQVLSSINHTTWRLKAGDAAFAKDTPFVPIVVGEFAAAQRSYPIVFSAGDAAPLVVLGLEQANLFVRDGIWDENTYAPAYVRRYPFGFVATAKPDEYVLAIDAGSDRVLQSGEEGVPLFESGQPSAQTKEAITFCQAFQAESQATQAFSEALLAQKLLIERRADVTLKDGRKLGVHGFQVMDVEKCTKLPDEVVLEWHRKGWLSLVYFHLASLDQFSMLLQRQNMRASSNGAAR